MDRQPLCGAPTLAGGACRWPRDRCTFHGARQRRSRPPSPPPPPEGATGDIPAAIERRDVRELAWWLMEALIGGWDHSPGNASSLTAVLRVLASMGPEPRAEEDALAEAELRGLIMHGVPPRTPTEWERAAAVFSPEALREIARWEGLLATGEDDGLLEGEGRDALQPFRLGDAAAEHLQVPGLVEDEDGVGGDAADRVARRGFRPEVRTQPFNRDELH